MVKTEGIGIAGKIAYGVAIAGVAVGLGFGAALGNANTDKTEVFEQ